ncbi:MAG: DOMON-like domain-containing protein [Cyanobacteriota bacterium]|jgi:hypothetical protein
MTGRILRPLLPFAPLAGLEDLDLAVELTREPEWLRLSYRLSGPVERLLIPEPAARPQRRDGLWQGTCLELFMAEAGRSGYRELNLCPSGHWNLYQLDGYRQGLRPEPAISALPVAVERTPGELRLALALPLAPLGLAGRPLELGITAVLDGGATAGIGYWALHHPSAEADFHHRGGFTLTLPAAEQQAADAAA